MGNGQISRSGDGVILNGEAEPSAEEPPKPRWDEEKSLGDADSVSGSQTQSQQSQSLSAPPQQHSQTDSRSPWPSQSPAPTSAAVHTPTQPTPRSTFALSLPPISRPPPSSPKAADGAPPSPLSPSWQLDSGEHRSLICRLCGGAACKREDWTRQPDYETTAAIRGLHSSFITPNIIAMQRPSSRLIAQHGIQQQFTALNITAVFNLQVSGEHALCGDGIHADGFSYHPDELLPCHHYGFGWLDMAVPSIERMLNVVQVMEAHERKGGRLAVHCHAGYGRTGMTIACFLMFAHHYSAEQAVSTVRSKREGSVQTREQKRFCLRFERYIRHIRCQFPLIASMTSITNQDSGSGEALPSLSPSTSSLPPVSPTPALPASQSYATGPLSLSSLLSNQRVFLHGAERQQFRFVSKLVSLVTQRLSSSTDELCKELQQRAAESSHSSTTSNNGVEGEQPASLLLHLPFDWSSSWTLEDSSALERLQHGANLNEYSTLQSASPFVVLVALLQFLTSLSAPLLPLCSTEAALPVSLSASFSLIPRHCLPTLQLVLAALQALHSCALPLSSDASPLSSFLLLSFGFALLHPPLSPPASLRLCLGERRWGLERQEARKEAEQAEALLCFVSVLLHEWTAAFEQWRRTEEEERARRRVGVQHGERWWLGSAAEVEPQYTSSRSSRRRSGNKEQRQRQQPGHGAAATAVDVSAPPAATSISMDAGSRASLPPLTASRTLSS